MSEQIQGQCDGCPDGHKNVTVIKTEEQDQTGMGGPPRQATYLLCDVHLAVFRRGEW